MSILFNTKETTPKRLNKKESFSVPLDTIGYGSLVVASLTLLISISGGLFL